MGVAGASLPGRAILLTGLAGLLAGGLSMAIGEWLSVQSARDLYEHQIGIERQELVKSPEAERQDLALIYQAKGIDRATVEAIASQLIACGDVAFDTLAREEVGPDPTEPSAAALVAACTSFLLFSLGAMVPVLPFCFGSGLLAIALSLLVSVCGLFVIGVGISLTTGVAMLETGGRQVVLGLLAAAVTFGIGKLIGHAVG
jgi:VIT1/CCC1 family predicted Fe2+/Mn2+ transporter